MDEDGISRDDLIEIARKFEKETKANNLQYYTSQAMEELIGFYMEENRLSLALEACEIAMQQHPFDTTFHTRCAQILNMTKLPSKALTVIEKGLSIEPTNIENILLKAQILEQLDQLEEALILYDLAIDLGGDYAEIILHKANNLVDIGEVEQAVSLVVELFTSKIESEHLFYESLLFIEVTRKWDKGIEMFTKYLDIDPFSTVAWSCLGHIYNETGLFEKAIWAYDFAVAIDDEYAEVHLQIGYCYSELGNFEKAAESFTTYLELEAPDPLSYASIADCFRAMNQYEVAQDYYRKALELDENFVDSWFGLGMIASLTGNYSEAIQFFNRTLDIVPEDDLYRIQLVHCFMEMEYWAQAEVLLKKVIKKRNKYHNAFLWLADCQHKQSKLDDAIATLVDWTERARNDDKSRYQLAAYYFQNGESQNGIHSLCEALLLNADNAHMIFEYAPELKDIPKIHEVIQLYTKEL